MDVTDMIMKGWRDSTKKQYRSYLTRWLGFCKDREWDPLYYSVVHCLEFLLELFTKGLAYSAINTARSALSCLFDEPPLGEQPKVVRFMRSVFIQKPPKPRYDKVWDVSLVLKYLIKCSPARDLTLKQLTLKLVTLCALVTGQRCQTIHSFNLDECTIAQTKITFYISTLLKHDAPGRKQAPIVLPSFPDDNRVCVVTYIKQYIRRTRPFRSSRQLFISFTQPHKPVSKDTISRWIKTCLTNAGINTALFKPHSTRAASTSAMVKDVDLSTIMKNAGWQRESTFAKYYNKPIKKDDSKIFGRSVLAKGQQ